MMTCKNGEEYHADAMMRFLLMRMIKIKRSEEQGEQEHTTTTTRHGSRQEEQEGVVLMKKKGESERECYPPHSSSSP